MFVCEMWLEPVVKRRVLQLVCCLFWFDYGMSGELCRRLHNEVIWHSFLIVQESMNKELCKKRTMKSNAVVNRLCFCLRIMQMSTLKSAISKSPFKSFCNVCDILNWVLANNYLVAFIFRTISVTGCYYKVVLVVTRDGNLS